MRKKNRDIICKKLWVGARYDMDSGGDMWYGEVVSIVEDQGYEIKWSDKTGYRMITWPDDVDFKEWEFDLRYKFKWPTRVDVKLDEGLFEI